MFEARHLSVMNYANGFTHWHYKATIPLSDTLAPAFFANAADLISAGDILMISAKDGAAQVWFDVMHKPHVMSRTGARQ